jgi:hypothetical protein
LGHVSTQVTARLRDRRKVTARLRDRRKVTARLRDRRKVTASRVTDAFDVAGNASVGS